MKCSVQSIAAGDAAYASERDRLQLPRAAPRPLDGDPLLRELPRAPRRPSGVEMLAEGLRAGEERGEG